MLFKSTNVCSPMLGGNNSLIKCKFVEFVVSLTICYCSDILTCKSVG